jgi:hypothetical protein
VIDMPATGRERVAAGVLVGAAVLFVGFAFPRTASAGFFGALTLPLVLLAADLVIAAAVVTWWYPLRPVAQGLAVFGILVHALVMLRSGPVWTRGCSGVLLLTHSWALVQLFLMTAAEDFDDEDFDDEDFDDEDFDDEDEEASGPPPDVASGEPAEFVEIPVTDVVDVAVPSEPAPPEAAPEAEDEADGDGASGETPTSPAAPDEPEHDPQHDPQHDSEERIR